MLFDDLERRRPALFVDAAAAGWDGYGKYPLARYPRLRAYVDQHYRPVEVRAGVVLYRRLPSGVDGPGRRRSPRRPPGSRGSGDRSSA